MAIKTAAGIMGDDVRYHTGGSVSVKVVAEDGETFLTLVMTAVLSGPNVRSVHN
jgi:hypothetical protein